MKPLTYIFLAVLTSSSCSSKFNSTELNESFTKTEREDLQKLTDFFQSQICDGQNDFKACMDSLIPDLSEHGWQPILENVDFDKQQKLYNSFKSDIFREIWITCKSYNPHESWERKSLCLNPNGKYIKFLQDLGRRNGVLKAYTESTLNSGDLGNMVAIEYEIFNNTGTIDLNDSGIQLLIAIDYLTQNEQQKRKEPWIEN
jgi:hypothetical protein